MINLILLCFLQGNPEEIGTKPHRRKALMLKRILNNVINKMILILYYKEIREHIRETTPMWRHPNYGKQEEAVDIINFLEHCRNLECKK